MNQRIRKKNEGNKWNNNKYTFYVITLEERQFKRHSILCIFRLILLTVLLYIYCTLIISTHQEVEFLSYTNTHIQIYTITYNNLYAHI